MRSLIILALGTLALASCGKKDDGSPASTAAQNASADSIGGNDVTAIDAATASDANIAEDVQLTVNDLGDLNASDTGEEPKARSNKAADKTPADTPPATDDDPSEGNAD